MYGCMHGLMSVMGANAGVGSTACCFAFAGLSGSGQGVGAGLVAMSAAAGIMRNVPCASTPGQ